VHLRLVVAWLLFARASSPWPPLPSAARGLCLDKFAAAMGRITAAKGLLCSFFPPSFLSLLLLLPASILVCLCFCRVHPSLLLECHLPLLHLHHMSIQVQ